MGPGRLGDKHFRQRNSQSKGCAAGAEAKADRSGPRGRGEGGVPGLARSPLSEEGRPWADVLPAPGCAPAPSTGARPYSLGSTHIDSEGGAVTNRVQTQAKA